MWDALWHDEDLDRWAEVEPDLDLDTEDEDTEDEGDIDLDLDTDEVTSLDEWLAQTA